MPWLSRRGSPDRGPTRLGATIACAVLIAATGCGGEQRTEPAAWADAVCDAFQDYRARIDDLAPRLGRGLDEGAGPAEAKRLIQDYLRDAVRATGLLEDDLASAGAPDVDGGSEVAADLQGGAERSGQLLRRALDQAGELRADDPDSFEERVEELSELLTAGLDEVIPELGAGSDELEVVLAERPACRHLGV